MQALGDGLAAEGAGAGGRAADGGQATQAALAEGVSAGQRRVGPQQHVQAHGARVLPPHRLPHQLPLQLLLGRTRTAF